MYAEVKRTQIKMTFLFCLKILFTFKFISSNSCKIFIFFNFTIFIYLFISLQHKSLLSLHLHPENIKNIAILSNTAAFLWLINLSYLCVWFCRNDRNYGDMSKYFLYQQHVDKECVDDGTNHCNILEEVSEGYHQMFKYRAIWLEKKKYQEKNMWLHIQTRIHKDRFSRGVQGGDWLTTDGTTYLWMLKQPTHWWILMRNYSTCLL